MVQLSTKTVRKILRDAYKHLKSLGNINKVPLNSTEESVTVVSAGEAMLRGQGHTGGHVSQVRRKSRPNHLF